MRPGPTHVVELVGRFQSNHGMPHVKALKIISTYVGEKKRLEVVFSNK